MSLIDHEAPQAFDPNHDPSQAPLPVWADEKPSAPAPANTVRSRRGRNIGILGGIAALVATGAAFIANSGGASSADKKPAGTGAPVVPGNGDATSHSVAASSPAEATSSAVEQGPTTIANLNLAELPAGVKSHTLTYNGWKMQVPDKLASPADNPALFVQEVLTAQAVAATVPTTSPEYGQMLDLLGHPNHTDTMGTVMHTWNTKVGELIPRTPTDTPQLAFYSEGELGVSYDPATHTTTVTSVDGQSGIHYAVGAFDSADVPWQSDILKQAAEGGTTPHSELPAYELTTTVDGQGNVVVTDMHTGK